MVLSDVVVLMHHEGRMASCGLILLNAMQYSRNVVVWYVWSMGSNAIIGLLLYLLEIRI